MKPAGLIEAGREEMLHLTVTDSSGKPAALEPYLGMAAHAVIARVDGTVYVHLHPMGTITLAAQQAFLARDRGDTTTGGALILPAAHPMVLPVESSIDIPYAFPKGGSYRL